MAQGAQLITPKYDTGTGKLIIGDGNDFQSIGIPPYVSGQEAEMVTYNPSTGGMSAGGEQIPMVEAITNPLTGRIRKTAGGSTLERFGQKVKTSVIS